MPTNPMTALDLEATRALCEAALAVHRLRKSMDPETYEESLDAYTAQRRLDAACEAIEASGGKIPGLAALAQARAALARIAATRCIQAAKSPTCRVRWPNAEERWCASCIAAAALSSAGEGEG